MHRLTPPKFGAKVVFTACIKQVVDKKLKRTLPAICGEIGKCDRRYRAAGRKAALFTLLPHDMVGKVSCDDMIKVYTGRMAKKGASGRLYYEKLMASAPQGRCPLCGQPMVSTLDHYLPKTEFPSLVVTPFNLIPSCGDCNKLKLNALAKTADEQTLHPYFDNVELAVWLKARILQTKPVAAQFYVDSGALPPNMAKRVEHHFNTFHLAIRYASQAANELVGIQGGIVNLLHYSGSTAVNNELLSRADSWAKHKVNCWQTALYAALAANDWYCKGGCKAK
jgi:5-methylcytosine-specific restriction endonuclease McrA